MVSPSVATKAYDKHLSGCTVAIAGLGLMGGSLGLALRGHAKQVIGIARRAESIDQALAMGAIDHGTQLLAEGVAQADIVVLATPVSVILQQLSKLARLADAGAIQDGMVLTDMGSTKLEICQAMAGLPDTIEPVGGHPMCGKETSGLAVAEAGLYQQAPFVLCPLHRTTPQAVLLLETLAEAIQARPLRLDPWRHDQLVSAVSHLPYVLATALFSTAMGVGHQDDMMWRLAASGFRSTTRLVGSDPKMMVDILLTNRAAILGQLEILQAQLAHYGHLIKQGEESQLQAALAAIREGRAVLLDPDGANG
jgi:prephenate dehydrogenase